LPDRTATILLIFVFALGASFVALNFGDMRLPSSAMRCLLSNPYPATHDIPWTDARLPESPFGAKQ
jgi:hypothetical protein